MKERKIRLFISSTFLDMNAERDYLNNFIFPQIELYCAERYIEFIPIDLRWGITEEARRNGLVIASCMDEVDNARPFFLGILGGRYGWMPEIDDLQCNRPSITQNQEWLLQKLTESASITEIEIEYATLRYKHTNHAIFFLKDDALELPPEYKESPGSLAEKKLKALKEKLRKQQDFPVYMYRNLQEIGNTILSELKNMIDTEFPKSEDEYTTSVISRHEYSLQKHSFTLYDISEYIDKYISSWSESKRGIFMITGDNGCGTSTHLAQMVMYLRKGWQYQEKIDKKRIVYYDFEQADSRKSYYQDFIDYLSLQKDPIRIIAIDNASLLNTDEASDLYEFLKDTEYPVMIASSGGAISTFLCNSRICEFSFVENMTFEQKKMMIEKFTLQYGKQLTNSQFEKLINGKNLDDPTILTILLSTLVKYGSMEKLDSRIEELVYDVEYSLFNMLISEIGVMLNDEKLADWFSKTIIAIAMHNISGISEKDIITSLSIPLADWAIIRPLVLQFCHSNTHRLRFIKDDWVQDVKNVFPTTWMAEIGFDLANYWWHSEGRDIEKYNSILSIYSFAWHLPFENEDDNRAKILVDWVLSIILSPQSSLTISNTLLSAVLSLCYSVSVSTPPPTLIGKPIEELPTDVQVKFYKRLANFARSTTSNHTNIRTEDAAWCYRKLSDLQESPDMAMVYKAKALLTEGKRTQAIRAVTDFWGRVKGTPEEEVQKRLIRLEAYTMNRDMALCVSEIDRVSILLEENDLEINIMEESLTMIAMSCFQLVISSSYQFWSIGKEIITAMYESEYDTIFPFTSPLFYYLYTTCALVMYRAQYWDDMQFYARHAMAHTFYSFGGQSYQYGRTHLLHNYAFLMLNGKLYENRSIFQNNYDPLPYRQDVSKHSEKNIQQNIENENSFFDYLVQQINQKLK